MRLEPVRPGALPLGTPDGEALGAVAGGDVGVELAAARELLARVVRVTAAGVPDVEVDVVGVGLPVQDEPKRRRRLEGGARLAQVRQDRVALAGLLLEPRGTDEPQVLAQDAIHAGEAAAGVLAQRAREGRVERAGGIALAQPREGQETVARGVIGALRDRLAVRVDRQLKPRFTVDPLEALPGEPPKIGARAEEVHDRAVGARGPHAIAARLVGLAQRDEREDVPGSLVPPREGARQTGLHRRCARVSITVLNRPSYGLGPLSPSTGSPGLNRIGYVTVTSGPLGVGKLIDAKRCTTQVTTRALGRSEPLSATDVTFPSLPITNSTATRPWSPGVTRSPSS